jgi:predicted RNase H-like HicB family nuclease
VQPRYHINLFWSDEDACWIADVPDLRYCSAHGETPEVALREVQTAMEAWLEVQRGEGRPIPEARYRPATYAGRRAA